MTHPTESQLNELLDDALTPDEKERVAGHVAACLPCTSSLRQIESLLERARALPREISPPGDAWDDVRAAVRAMGTSTSAPALRPAWWRLAAAAAVLVVAAIAGARWLAPDSREAPTSSDAVAAPASLAAFGPVEARYVLAASALEGTLAERRAALDPATVAIVERSLATIDTAIAEARAALARDPGNTDLTRLLASSYEQKVTLLRRASELAPRT